MRRPKLSHHWIQKLPFRATLFCLGALFACGGKGTSDGQPAPSQNAGPLLPTGATARRDALTVVIQPFIVSGPHNVTLVFSKDAPSWSLRGVATLPGFHWPWTSVPPDRYFYVLRTSPTTQREASASEMERLVAADGGKGVLALRYFIPFTRLPENVRWPAVVGTVGASSGTTAFPAFLRVTPDDLGGPIRLHVADASLAPAEVRAKAKSCGRGCVEFENAMHAFDVPFSIAAREADITMLGGAADFPFFVHASDKETLGKLSLAKVEGVRALGKRAWDALNARLGAVSAGPSFQTHINLQRGCSYQGLEHHETTLLSVGVDCTDDAPDDVLLLLALHEFLHVWNAKFLFPSENAQWDAGAFSSERLAKLYFYEGFTEGLTRVLATELGAPGRLTATIDKRWNATFAALAAESLGGGKSPESLSRASPGLGYHLGSFLALEAWARARKAFGPQQGDLRVWNILKSLAHARDGDPAFDFGAPHWTLVTFGKGIARMKEGVRGGYDAADLRQAFVDGLGPEASGAIVARYFDRPAESGVFTDLADLNGLIGAHAATLGRETKAGTSGLLTWR